MRNHIKKNYGKVLINLIGIVIVFIGILFFTNFQVNAFSIEDNNKVTY